VRPDLSAERVQAGRGLTDTESPRLLNPCTDTAGHGALNLKGSKAEPQTLGHESCGGLVMIESTCTDKPAQAERVRTPLESGMITLGRSDVHARYPARFRVQGGGRVVAEGVISGRLKPAVAIATIADAGPAFRLESYQPKTVGPALVGVIRIRQRRCLIMAVR
jgi:hypothetical protein